ncbi:MAG: hypothetical protein LRY27_04635 [Chitinophagales bacterium]|nr:hypothetical protein [Chitinophagales bacterium]
MKQIIVIALLAAALNVGCKQCVECHYSSLKGTIQEKYCSSTKQDRIDFEAHMDSLATYEGSVYYCEKAKY